MMGWRQVSARAALIASLSAPATAFGNTRAPLVASIPVAFTL